MDPTTFKTLIADPSIIGARINQFLIWYIILQLKFVT